MRILLLSQWFDPEPHFKGLPFAKALRDLGHEVQVVTGFPNYPGGKVYPGYKLHLFQREILEGIPVIRVLLYPSHDRSGLRRILNYVSFAISASLFGTLLSKPADIIYVYHPPGTVGLPALVMRFLKKAPFVYDIQDLWPESVEASGMIKNKPVLWLLSVWCRLVYHFADRIVVLSPGFKEALKSKGVPGAKIDVIFNWCDDTAAYSESRDEKLASELGFANRFNIVFAGTMGKGQGLKAVLDAAEIVHRRQPEIQFVFVGGGTEVDNLKRRAETKELANVLFLERRPVSQIWKILNLADALLVHLRDDPLYEITIPSKTQAYMAAGKPILMGVKGDAEKLVLAANAGFACVPGDPCSIADCACQLFSMPKQYLREIGANGRNFYEKHLCLEVGVKAFERVFFDVLRERSLE